MPHDDIVFYIFIIFTGAAVLSTIALYARQSLLVVYILLGILFGPSVLNTVSDPRIISQLSHIGIIFLLFLLGVNLPVQKLKPILGQMSFTTLISSATFFLLGGLITLLFGFNIIEAAIVGLALMFSSTIIGLKLLPTTVLHHKHTGEIIISILLLQDIIAILLLMILPADWQQGFPALKLVLLVLSLIGLLLFAYLFERYILTRLLMRFDKIQEYIFLLAIGWCLGIAELATLLGLSAEIGAFIAGVALAANPISLFIGENLKPLRDFFLIIFFFALGASFDLTIIEQVLIPGVVIAITMLIVKPFIFKWLIIKTGSTSEQSMEIGVRLGQVSEFSLFIAVLALDYHMISTQASYLIQVATLITFIISSYFIVQKYPTPISVSDKLRRD